MTGRADILPLTQGEVVVDYGLQHVIEVAALLRTNGYVGQDDISLEHTQGKMRLTESDLEEILWEYEFFIPAQQRWRIAEDDGEFPDDLDVDNSRYSSNEDPLFRQVLGALTTRPLQTAEALAEGPCAGLADEEEIETILSSSEVFEQETTTWWLHVPTYVNWLENQILEIMGGESVESQPSDAYLAEESMLERVNDYEDTWEFYQGPSPRSWQMKALTRWNEEGRHGIVEAVTGTGKTLLGVLAAAQAAHLGEKVLITVPTLVLLEQWTSALEKWAPDLKVGQFHQHSKDHIDECDVLVSTAQSATRYWMASKEHPTLHIADEVHGYGSPARSEILNEDFASRLGLTATLERDNDEGVAELILPAFQSVVYTYSYPDALRDGVLAPFKIGFIGVTFTDEEEEEYRSLGREMGSISQKLKARGIQAASDSALFAEIARLSGQTDGDFQLRMLAQKFMSNLSRRKALQAEAENKIVAIEAIAEPLAEATRGLVFTETIESARTVSQTLEADGIAACAFDSSLTQIERQQVLDEFRVGDLSVLCAPRILDEGVDVPDADVGVIIAASKSKRQMIQRLGRIVRPNPQGHPSTLFILYVQGTREDPQLGAHEGFLGEVEPHATRTAYFEGENTGSDLTEWMMSDR